MGVVPPSYLGLSAGEVLARLLDVAAAAAGAPVAVRVGEDVFGCRNVGVDLPRARLRAAETRLLRQRVRAALEREGVVLAEAALSPKVAGDIRGSVRVREVVTTLMDGAHMLKGSSRR